MAGFFTRLASQLSTARVPAKPFAEQGVAGFTSAGGYIVTSEKNAAVAGPNRWHTAQDLLTNISIIAASVRYSMNLISRPAWRADPASDKPEAKAMAEFVEEVINGADTSWSRIVRRSTAYRYHGFNLQEWVAKKRDDGKIGIDSVEQRPAHTIRKWDLDENGGVVGVVQASPQTGQEVYLPRKKLVYLVDDSLTDSPEGMGWFRHLADPAQRLRRFLKLETMGFERDLAGIPVGRAPLQRINELVTAGRLSKKQADAMIKSLEDFVQIAAKEPSTGLLLDSEPFRAKTESGETVSSVMQWGMELLTGSPGSMADLGNSIHRVMLDMAMIIGTDSLLIGQGGRGGGGGGSRALSEDKSKSLYLTSNAALSDMAEAFDRDIVTPLWMMNGFPDELRPRLKTEDVSFKDAEGIAQALANMATAGAILHPNDPAINDLRDLMGISAAPPVDETTADLMLGAKAGVRQDPANDTGAGGGGGGGRPSRENPGGNGPPARGKGGEAPPNPKSGAGRAQKEYDPNEPRDDHGRWTEGGGGEGTDPSASAAFKSWFGDSKVVDKNGNPMVVYHGSLERDLESFDTERETGRGQGDVAGTYFTSDAMSANGYTRPPIGERVGDLKDKRGKVYAAYLSLQNPLDTTAAIARGQRKGLTFGDAKREALKGLDRSVHDGIMFRGNSVNPAEFVAFRPSQIKSISNGGTFDPNDPSIYK